MKTNFETEEDIEFLAQLYREAIENTDIKIFPAKDYYEPYEGPSLRRLIDFRKKCFEILEEEDPHHATIVHILNKFAYEN